MGCSKSKLQQERSEAYVQGGNTNPWEHGQEVQRGYNNFQLYQNQISNNEFQPNSYIHNNLPGTPCMSNSRDATGYNYRNVVNATGSFGDGAPSYCYERESNRVQYFNNNKYYNGNLNHIGSDTDCFTYNNFRQNQIQPTYISHLHPNQYQYQSQEQIHSTFNHEESMGPPSRPVSRARNNSFSFVRRSSINNSYRGARHNNQFNSMVRHSSLESISGFRNRHSGSDSNLYQNSSVFNRPHINPKSPNLKRNSGKRGKKRGLKRAYQGDDSLSSTDTNNEGSESIKINDDPIEPLVKRRPPEVIGPSSSSENISKTDNNNREKEDKGSKNETKTTNEDIPSCDDEAFDILDLLVFPDDWSSCMLAKTGLVDISLTSLEGKSVQQYFSRSSQSKDFKLSITGIARIENPFMHSSYLLKKQEMESRNGRVDVLYLYHGTKKENLEGILKDNLNWRLFSEKHRFGQGVSFSPLATYSSHYSDRTSEKVMLLFKVLASNSIGGSPNMKIPPIVKSIVYDTSIKDDTTVIVKYSDDEFYPLYKITYTKTMWS